MTNFIFTELSSGRTSDGAAGVVVMCAKRASAPAMHASTPPPLTQEGTQARVRGVQTTEAWENSKSAMSPLPIVEVGGKEVPC